ncbi:hypothetical protein ACFSTC_38755 [Nonomuraea ferruginea]
MFREAVRAFGAERGAAMRLDHLSKGLTLDLVNMMELYDSGGNEDVWQYRDEGTLTPRRMVAGLHLLPVRPALARPRRPPVRGDLRLRVPRLPVQGLPRGHRGEVGRVDVAR